MSVEKHLRRFKPVDPPASLRRRVSGGGTPRVRSRFVVAAAAALLLVTLALDWWTGRRLDERMEPETVAARTDQRSTWQELGITSLLRVRPRCPDPWRALHQRVELERRLR